MSSLTPNVSPLRQRMIDDMRMRKFNGKTQIHYIRAVRRLAAFLKRSPDTATAEDLRTFQLHMVDTGTSPPTINSTLSGLKFFFDVTLGPRRADGQDAAGASAATAAGGAERRGGYAPDRRCAQRQVPGGAVGGLRRRTARQRGLRAQGHRHRQRAHDAARGARQGPQGSLRHAVTRIARAAARMVAGGPCAGQDVAQRLAVPGAQPHGLDVHPAAQPRDPSGRGRGAHRQARVDAHAAPQLCHPPAGAEGRYPRDPGAAWATSDWRPPRCTPTWPPRCCAQWSARWRRCHRRSPAAVGRTPWKSPTSSAVTGQPGAQSSTVT